MIYLSVDLLAAYSEKKMQNYIIIMMEENATVQ
jgi:hypothetical protein